MTLVDEPGQTPGAPAAAGDAEELGEDGRPRRRRRGRRGGVRHRRRREAAARRGTDGDAVPSAANTAEGTETDDAGVEIDDVGEENRTDAVAAPVVAAPPQREAPPGRRPRGGQRGEPRADRAPSDAPRRSRRRGRRRDSDDAIAEREDDGVAAEIEGEDRADFDVIEPDADPGALPAEDDGDLDGPDVDDAADAGPATLSIETIDNPLRSAAPGTQEMLINVADADECRIAIVAGRRLDELYMERTSSASHVGNIYKGRVTNVEPAIQAAFVDFGLPAHGFLHISDVHPQYFPNSRGDHEEEVGRKTPRRERPPIQRCLRRGQEVIVQITKEGIGTKGPTMTTYLSVPGRFLVMMPGLTQLGVTRKVEDDDQRRKARAALAQLKLPTDMGFIVRTAGVDRTRRELQHDLNYLVRLWRSVQRRIETQRAPCELYQESDLVIRTVRDVYTTGVSRIIVDDEQTARKVAEFLSIANPRGSDRVVWYTGSDPLFHLYGIEQEIEKLHSRHVELACGGSLVIDPTEALVAIDVNSGRFRVQNDAEETARRVNLEAATEIARQLRLRDLGGVIICDFIDMRFEKHRREVERALRDGLKGHKERAKILRMSQFGIIEMTRQRQRPSISRSVYQDCPHCRGSGLVKTVESMTLDVLRVVQLASHREGVNLIEVRVSAAAAAHLLNRKRYILSRLEADTGRTITISAMQTYGPDQVTYTFLDRRGREVPLLQIAPPGPLSQGVRPHARPEIDVGRARPQLSAPPQDAADQPRRPERRPMPSAPDRPATPAAAWREPPRQPAPAPLRVAAMAPPAGRDAGRRVEPAAIRPAFVPPATPRQAASAAAPSGFAAGLGLEEPLTGGAPSQVPELVEARAALVAASEVEWRPAPQPGADDHARAAAAPSAASVQPAADHAVPEDDLTQDAPAAKGARRTRKPVASRRPAARKKAAVKPVRGADAGAAEPRKSRPATRKKKS